MKTPDQMTPEQIALSRQVSDIFQSERVAKVPAFLAAIGTWPTPYPTMLRIDPATPTTPEYIGMVDIDENLAFLLSTRKAAFGGFPVMTRYGAHHAIVWVDYESTCSPEEVRWLILISNRSGDLMKLAIDNPGHIIGMSGIDPTEVFTFPAGDLSAAVEGDTDKLGKDIAWCKDHHTTPVIWVVDPSTEKSFVFPIPVCHCNTPHTSSEAVH